MGAISKGDSMEWLKNRLDPDLYAISFQFSFLVLGTLFVVILLFAACNEMPDNEKSIPGEIHGTGMTYEYFTIDGMPCIYIDRYMGADSRGDGGPSCDWSKWKGE